MRLYRGRAALVRALEPPRPTVRVRPWGVLAWLLVVLLALVGAIASAADLRISTLISPNADTAKVPRANQAFYQEWRRGASRWTELLAANEEVRKAVGAPLDRQGALCVAWTKMADFAEETLRALEARCTIQRRPLPGWVVDATQATRERADKECSDKDDGNGGTRDENLGVLYMRELAKMARREPEVRRSLTEDAALLDALRGLIQNIEELLPAANGRLAPAGGGLPILDPRLFMRTEERTST